MILGLKNRMVRVAARTVWHTPQAHKALHAGHNGKVERSHRKDNEYFYATHTFYSFDDLKSSLLFTAVFTITFLCVLLTGCLPPIILKLILKMVNFSDFVTHH